MFAFVLILIYNALIIIVKGFILHISPHRGELNALYKKQRVVDTDAVCQRWALQSGKYIYTHAQWTLPGT